MILIECEIMVKSQEYDRFERGHFDEDITPAEKDLIPMPTAILFGPGTVIQKDRDSGQALAYMPDGFTYLINEEYESFLQRVKDAIIQQNRFLPNVN